MTDDEGTDVVPFDDEVVTHDEATQPIGFAKMRKAILGKLNKVYGMRPGEALMIYDALEASHAAAIQEATPAGQTAKTAPAMAVGLAAFLDALGKE